MSVKFHSKQFISSETKGFTLLELIVVMAGLAILSSLAIPNYMRLLDFNNIDEVKSLLNTAAADCLQKSRINGEEKDVIDDEILSDIKLNTIGYQINPDRNTCSDLELRRISEQDDLRYDIGFSVFEGKLTKYATPISTDKASNSSCENWAGINCKENQELKELLAYRKEIDAAAEACDIRFQEETAPGLEPHGLYTYWDPNATSGCPTKPPKIVNSTCTTEGCRKQTYFFEGINLRSDDPAVFEEAQREKNRKLCSEWVTQVEAEGTLTNDPPDRAVTKFPICEDRKFWFCKGVDKKSESGLKVCLQDIESDKCLDEKNELRESGYFGRWKAKEGPGECGKPQYMCNKTFYDETDYFINCHPEPPEKCKRPLYGADGDCLAYELTDFINKMWSTAYVFKRF